MANRDELGIGTIFLTLAVSLVIGVPIVAVLWNAVNEVVAGNLGRLAVAVPLLVLFAAFLVVFGRQLRRLESRR